MVRKAHEYLDHVLERLSPVGQITVRAMFGGYGLYLRGIIFAIIANDQLYFKVNEKTKLEYQSMGCSPFMYAGKNKPVTMSYWNVPEQVMEDDAMLKRWALAAYHASKEKKDA